MVFTRRFWFFCLAGIPIAAICWQIDLPVLAIIYDLLLLAGAYASIKMGPGARHLKVTRKFDAVLSVRAWNRILVRLENEGKEQISLTAIDEPPAAFECPRTVRRLTLPPGESKSIEYWVRPAERGSDEFQGTYVRVDCPFGLVQHQVRIPSSQEVRVYPNILALKQFDLLRQTGRLREIGIRHSRIRGAGSDFESLRHYSEGDDYRKIDWKATARKGELVVRQFEQERNQVVIVCIDIGRHMLSEVEGIRKLDHVLDSLLMLANAATVAGDLIGLLVFSDTVRRFLPPKKGRAQLGLFIEACHDLVAEPLESDFAGAMAYLSQRWTRRSLLVCFTDCNDPDQADALLNSFVPVSRRHLALLCRISDPKTQAMESLRIQTPREIYSKAAAGILSLERKKALSKMVLAKVHVLDSEPQELAANLVSHYFLVKERSLL